MVVCVLALLIGGCYAYYKYIYVPDQRRRAQETVIARQTAAEDVVKRQRDEKISELLRGAAEDLERDRLTSPAGANAWEKYQAVLELLPGHRKATAGLDTIVARYVMKFGTALRGRNFEKAGGYVSRIRGVWADVPVLPGLERRLSEARGAQKARLAAQEAKRRREAQIASYTRHFEKALGERELDQAGRYLDSLRAVGASAGVLSGKEGRLSAARETQRLRRTVGGKFRDCAECPEMVVVPSGSFTMGSPGGESGRYENEGPRHRVRIGYRFAVGVSEVTFAEWDACANAGGCGGYRPNDNGWGRGNRPVINVSWDDAQSYVRWLSERTGETYRLMSESEWEYVARGGTTTRYHWGHEIGHNRANCNGCGSRWDNKKTAPVGAFSANAWGLYDVHGNVWEWVADCWNNSYTGVPVEGSAWTRGDCAKRVLRGGSWYNEPRLLRSALRGGNTSGARYSFYGFRIARTLNP